MNLAGADYFDWFARSGKQHGVALDVVEGQHRAVELVSSRASELVVLDEGFFCDYLVVRKIEADTHRVTILLHRAAIQASWQLGRSRLRLVGVDDRGTIGARDLEPVGLHDAADLAHVADCQRLVAEAIAQMGTLDILVNNAGVQQHAAFLDAEPADYDRVLAVNLRAPFFVTQAFARHRVEQGGGGCVINNSSVHEELPFPNFTSYCASKGGLKMLARNLALELAPHGIRVNNVAPGAIETPINQALMNRPDTLARLLENIPAGRLGQPRDVAGAVAFLASADADYVTGTTLVVDGGLLWQYSEQ